MQRLPIHSIMTSPVITVTRDTPVPEALRLLDERGLSCLVVTEAARPVGVFTEWDALAILACGHEITHPWVERVMRPPLVVHAHQDVREVYQGMLEADALQAIVVDAQGDLQGIVTEGDLLHLIDTAQLAELKPVSRVMQREPLCLPPEATLAEAAQGMTARQTGTVLVTVDRRPIGILTERDMVHLIRAGILHQGTTLQEVMSQPVHTLREDTPLREAGLRMEQLAIRRLVVVDGEGRLAGLLTRHEVVKTLQGRYLEFLRELLKEQGKDLHRTRHALEQTRRELIYRRVMAQVNEAVMVIDAASGEVIETNDRAKSLLGDTPSATSPVPIWTLCPSILGPEDWATFLHHLHEQGSLLVDLTFRASDGQPIPMETSISAMRAEGIDYVVLLARDLRERRAAEERLRRSESQLREAQRIAHVGSWELDHTSGELIWSEEVFRIFEIEYTAFGSDYPAFLALVHPEDREAVDQAYARHLAERTPYDIIHRLLFPDGRIKYVHEQCETSFDAQGHPLRSVGTVHDVTALKEAENRLRETQDMLRLVINTIPHAVFWKDRNCRYLGSNESFAHSAGVASAEELIGKRDEELAWKDHAEAYQRDDLEVMSSGIARHNYNEPQTTHPGWPADLAGNQQGSVARCAGQGHWRIGHLPGCERAHPQRGPAAAGRRCVREHP